MWLFTTFGFFSVVQKPETNYLTVRARVEADLNMLRESYMPQLSKTIAAKGTDYPYRATISHEAFSSGLAQLGANIHYGSFKEEVVQALGAERSLVYSEVWCHLHRLEAENQENITQPKANPFLRKKNAYGGIVVDCDGRILLREPFNHHGGYIWTFPKDSPYKQERPEDAAVRAVLEKTGIKARIIEIIPGIYIGEMTSTTYYLMSYEGQNGNNGRGNKALIWATREEAETRIKMSSSVIGRARDLEVLNAAYTIINQRYQRTSTSAVEIEEIESNILNCAALRFDGYKYMDAAQYDSQAGLEDYLKTGQPPQSPLDQMCLAFTLQRYLMKWSSNRQPRTGKYWKAFRSLFLLTCRYCIPPEYRYLECNQRWSSEFIPKLKECVALIQVIHASTQYEEVAPAPV